MTEEITGDGHKARQAAVLICSVLPVATGASDPHQINETIVPYCLA